MVEDALQNPENLETDKQKSHDIRKRGRIALANFILRNDLLAWIAGVSFIAVMSSAIMLAGNAAGWDSSIPYKHYNTTSRHRFSPEPIYCNETNVKGRHGERCAGRWYYWKLPTKDVTALTKAVPWICYSLHQIVVWVAIYLAQTEKEIEATRSVTDPKFGSRLSKYNWFLLVANAIFFLIHLGQTHWTYDGLAQYVSLASPEGASIMVLALILVMEYKTRGVLFMWPNKDSHPRTRLNMEPVNVARKYHGYLFAWSIIYTFWYHPMENTWGHVIGFIHGGMVLLQGSLLYTKFHLNRYWRLLIECWVIFHGSFIALWKHDPDTYRQQWPLYFLGFGFILVCTQIFGLPFWAKVHWAGRVVPPILLLGTSLLLCKYDIIRGNTQDESNYSKLKETFYIPLEMYLLMLGFWVLALAWLKLEGHLKKLKYNAASNSGTAIDSVAAIMSREDSQDGNPDVEAKPVWMQALGIGGFLFIHAVMITISFLILWLDFAISNSSIMFMLVAVFTFCWSVAVMMLKMAIETRVAKQPSSENAIQANATETLNE